eukprot:GHVQ01017766.1.p1 GENE.GHVQ01017766.1~~GHVQ01017766.1.p1  ORF type:complete len:375 (+),score=35.13 GHVQ01017766.1:377-1501(+)
MNGSYEGNGLWISENEEKYHGEWKKGKRHGHGTFWRHDGSVYEGQWFLDEICGFGVLTEANGDKYSGHFLKNKKEGSGTLNYFESGRRFHGEWANGVPRCGEMSLCCDNDAGTSSTGEEFSSLADCSEDVDQCTLTGAERCSSRTPMTVRTSEKHCLALKDKEQVLKEGTDAVKSWRCAYRMMNTPLTWLHSQEELDELREQHRIQFETQDTTTSHELIIKLREFVETYMSLQLGENEIQGMLQQLQQYETNDNSVPESRQGANTDRASSLHMGLTKVFGYEDPNLWHSDKWNSTTVAAAFKENSMGLGDSSCKQRSFNGSTIREGTRRKQEDTQPMQRMKSGKITNTPGQDKFFEFSVFARFISFVKRKYSES